MRFLEAREALKKLSEGKYRCLRYEVTDSDLGGTEIECAVYTDDNNKWYVAPTWEEVLQKLESAMYPDREPSPKVEDVGGCHAEDEKCLK